MACKPLPALMSDYLAAVAHKAAMPANSDETARLLTAAGLDIAALATVRAVDAELVQRIKATYRGLIAKQDRYRRLVRQLVRRLEVAQ